MISSDRGLVFKGFGSLDYDQVARMDVVVAKAKASADEAAALVPNILTQGWDSLIGASSSVEALKSNAAAAQNLYETLLAKRNRLANDSSASESDVQTMEGSTYAMTNAASTAAADQLSISAAYDQVVAQSATDLTSMISNPFGIPWWLWGVGALGVLFLWQMPRRK